MSEPWCPLCLLPAVSPTPDLPPFLQVAVKEASQARQEEDKTEQRRRARADKKSQKKGSKPPGRPGEKRKAQEDFQDWGDEPGREPIISF